LRIVEHFYSVFLTKIASNQGRGLLMPMFLRRLLLAPRCLLLAGLLLTVSLQAQQPDQRFSSLGRFLNHARVLILIDMQADDTPFSTQWDSLAAAVPALTSRNITVVPVLKIESVALPAIAGLRTARLNDTGAISVRTRFTCNDTDFCLILLDLNGKTLASSNAAVPVSQLIQAVDAAIRHPNTTPAVPPTPPVEDAATFSTTPIPATVESRSNMSVATNAVSSDVRHGNLETYFGTTRLLVVIAQQADDAAFTSQWHDLQQHVAELRDRNVTVVPVLRIQSVTVPSIALPTGHLNVEGLDGARDRFKCGDPNFCIALVDLDGTMLLRSETVVPAAQLISAIDITPAREKELQQNAQPSPQR
jgi:hypothetical protein